VAKTLKVGVIGVGGIAKTHMPGWAASSHAEVIAGSDINDKGLEDGGKQHGVTRLAADRTRQLYNRTLKLTKDSMEPHALECVEFARAVAEGAPSPAPAEQSPQVLTILDGI
jgi:predicted dehydrogenase